MSVDTTGTGVATHLGLFTVTWEFTVNLLNGAGIGSAHFIAANGDSVFTESLGQGDPTETPDISRVVERHTITEGTGRFAGATGYFTLERLVNTATGDTAGSFNGTIVIHNAKQPLQWGLGSGSGILPLFSLRRYATGCCWQRKGVMNPFSIGQRAGGTAG